MAKIWPVYEGKEPTRGEPWAELSASEAIALFGLEPTDFISDLTTVPRFGHADSDLWYLGYKHIVVEIGARESRQAKLKPGFYRSRVQPKDAFKRLVQHALVAELGAENVIRVQIEPATDSQGHEAVKITIVVDPATTKKLAKEASLNALVRLQDQLNKMREDRTPIIEYATEAELAQDGAA